MQLAIITIPFTANIFKVYSLDFKDWGIVILISLIPFAINEIVKIFFRTNDKKRVA